MSTSAERVLSHCHSESRHLVTTLMGLVPGRAQFLDAHPHLREA